MTSTLGVLASLWVNLSLLVFFSLSSTSSVRERMIASDFIRHKNTRYPPFFNHNLSCRRRALGVERILGKEKTAHFSKTLCSALAW